MALSKKGQDAYHKGFDNELDKIAADKGVKYKCNKCDYVGNMPGACPKCDGGVMKKM